MAKVKGAPNSKGADAFLKFLMSRKEQKQLAEEAFQIPTVKLKSPPSWLAPLKLKKMKVDWDEVAKNEKEWISYWSEHIKNKN